MSFGRFAFICISSSFLFLQCSCRPAAEADGGFFFALTESGIFEKIDSLTQVKPIPFRPWPQQVRVADVGARNDRFFLAVNQFGLAEVTSGGDGRSFSIQMHYDETFFNRRTVTRIFLHENRLFCHVYRDTDFPTDTVSSPPIDRITLLEFRPAGFDADYRIVPLRLPPTSDGWEAVTALPINVFEIGFEWKKSLSRKTLFRYTSYDFTNGKETEKTREWFYRRAEPVRFSGKESDPVLRALVPYIAASLQRDDADGVVFCTGYDPAAGRESRYYFPAPGGKAPAARYRSVLLDAVEGGWLALLPDQRYIFAQSSEEKTWGRGSLPPLPDGFRYTGLAGNKEWMCFSWEEIDFYRVGRAGILLKRRSKAAF